MVIRNLKKDVIYQELGNTTLVYAIRDGVMTFTCVPNSKKKDIKEHRLYKDSWSQYFGIDPMVQIARTGDAVNRDFSSGETSYNSATSYDLKPIKQEVIEDDIKKEIRTYFEANDGFKAVHVARQIKGFEAFELFTEITNGKDTCNVERASSFNISALSPLLDKNDPEKLVLHTLQSYWSIEGRKESTPLSKYNFEDSWSALGIKIHRIGALGAMPARNYIPFVALEDKISKVTWAVQLEAPDSWEIETIHRYGGIDLCGGHADYLYGHWRKCLKEGEVFVTRKAYVSVVKGNLTKACACLTRYHDNLLKLPKSEESLPIIYNEYLHSWGNPNMENLPPQIELAHEMGATYFVVDAGWFGNNNDDTLGDWDTNNEKFPNGLIEYSKLCKEKGYEACGVWYEFEAATTNSKVCKNIDWLAKRDNHIIKRNNRYLLDFNNKDVLKYLDQKVIDNLKNNDLNYIKIDYNENIGYGIDGDDSVGENIRTHAENVVSFMKKLRDEVPNLVLENCSSGGMRHEVTYDTLGSMVSFSDAHEIPSGAVIAMDLHRIMQPRIMQIWASILPKMNEDEIYFTMAKAMLGRICLSGRMDEVKKEYLTIVKEGVAFYDDIKDVIKDGETTLIDTDDVKSILNPHGVIRLVRKTNKKMVCYAFAYGNDNKQTHFNCKGYKLEKYFGNASIKDENTVDFNKKKLSCAVLIYKKEQ